MPTVTKSLNDPFKIIRDVHDLKNIEAKTDLNVIQIEAINMVRTLAWIFDSDFLERHISDLLILLKSKDRKSMGEFIEAVKSAKESLMDKEGKQKSSMLG